MGECILEHVMSYENNENKEITRLDWVIAYMCVGVWHPICLYQGIKHNG